MTFQLLPEKVVHPDIYIFQLNVAKVRHPVVSDAMMNQALTKFNERAVGFGEFDYKRVSGSIGLSRHLNINEAKVCHIVRNARVEDGWLMADIEIRPRTPQGGLLMQVLGDGYPARTPPEDVTNPIVFKLRYFTPDREGEKCSLANRLVIVTIDAVPNPYLKADNGSSRTQT